MHVFLLIISLSGHPEKIAAICETYQQCSDMGAALSLEYQRTFNVMPRDVAYRVISASIVPDVTT
jgi:hypothetical protein